MDCLILLDKIVVKSSYDPLKGGIGGWRYAIIMCEKIRLTKASFWIERNDQEEEYLKLLPKHARHQNMTYFFKLKVDVHLHHFFNVDSCIMVSLHSSGLMSVSCNTILLRDHTLL